MSSSRSKRVLLLWLVSRLFGQQPQMLDEEPRRRRRYRTHPIVSQPSWKGPFRTLYQDLRQRPEKFHEYCRMSISTFDRLLESLRDGLAHQETNTRPRISAVEQLIVTLRYLATGDTFASLHLQFALRISTIRGIIHSTCQLIWSALKDIVMPAPTPEQWLQIADGFHDAAQFPNCIGALDGKLICVKEPSNSGSGFSNYKPSSSVVLLALADSKYRFVIVDIGAYGSTADAGCFSASRLGQQILNNQLSLPEASSLPGSSGPLAPFVIAAGKGFGVSQHVLHPFSRRGLDTQKRVFNYRLTRARRYVECAFRILANNWRVLHSAIQLDPENVDIVIQACIMLHNFVRMHDATFGFDVEHQFPPFSPSLDQTPHGKPGTSGLAIRDLYADYFMTPEGSVPWQQDQSC